MEMAVCAAYRIPHSHFLGGPHVWTQADRDKAIWHQVRKAETCHGCGTHPDDWDEAKGGRPDAYRAKPHLCRGCQVLQLAQDQAERKAGQGAAPSKGVSIVLRRREEVLDAGDHGAGGEPRRVDEADAAAAVGG